MKPEQEKLSRREFLKAGIITGKALLAELILPEKARAQVEKLIGPLTFFEETFENSLKRIKKEVFTSPIEVFWAYIKKEGRQGLLDIQSPIVGAGLQTDRAAGSIDILPILEDREIEEVDFIHTHPAILYKKSPWRALVPNGTYEEALRTQKTKLPLIPSGRDIVNVMGRKLYIEDRGFTQLTKDIVVEPSGVWIYDANVNHSRILSFFKDGEKISAKTLRENKRLWEELERDLTNRQSKFWKEGGITPETLEDFKKWAEKEWGIFFSYDKF